MSKLKEDTRIYHTPSIVNNLKVVSESRNLASVLTGIVAGILKVEGIVLGGAFFVLAMCISSLLILASLRGEKTSAYFQHDFFFNELFSGLLVFVLTWTLSYDLVHLF